MQHLLDEEGDIDRFVRRAFVSPVDHQLSDNLPAANGSGPDSLQFFLGGRVLGVFGQSEFRGCEDAAQQIIEIVSDAARQLAHRFEFLTGKGRFQRALHVGDIGAGANVAGEHAARREPWNAFVQHPAVFVVRAVQPVLHSKTAPGIKARDVSGEASIQVCGVHALGPAIAQFLLHGPTPELQPCLVEESAESVLAGDPDHHGRRISHIAEPLFAFAKLLALGDIHD